MTLRLETLLFLVRKHSKIRMVLFKSFLANLKKGKPKKRKWVMLSSQKR